MEPSKHTLSKPVLVVEASDLVLCSIVPIIEKLGYRVIKAHDLESAHAVVKETEPIALVLLGDISRPTQLISGIPAAELALLLEIKKSPIHSSVPVVVFTSIDWITHATTAHADAILIKPAGAAELEALIIPHLCPNKTTSNPH